jgi:uncharacterized protein involved in response to NO
MLFGYTSAVIAGFLLTATQNWTGQVTARGGALLALAGSWLAGRIACAAGGAVPWLAATVDIAFLPVLASIIARPILRSRNARNVGMPVVLVVLALANTLWWYAALHYEALALMRAKRVSLDLVALLILSIGGRILPGFTSNAVTGLVTRARNALDTLGMASLAALVVADVTAPLSSTAAYCAALAGVLNAARLWGWGGSRALGRPILAVLHIGFGCTAAALILRALASLTGVLTESNATHLLTVGGIGSMTLGMMARVALGHTGRPLSLAPSMVVALHLLALSTLTRVFGPLLFAAHYPVVLWVSGTLWVAAFGLFLARYTPWLLAPRADGKPG